ncbi:MAG: histidinol-phosphate transaminase [Candidatus Omnitrophica bacterium]|nr:histidinol-phosphate transaminase [Candidatus Omnitrophota bacterium]
MIQSRRALRGLASYEPGRPIEEVQRELGLTDVLKLASNENALGPSPKAVAAVREALGGVHRYPDSHGTVLRQKLAGRLGVTPEQVVLGNGSDELITLALRAYVEPGDEVVVADPTFLIYRLAGQVAGAAVRSVPLTQFRYDLPAMRRAITRRTRMVFVANPDNPTGTYVTAREVAAFLNGLSDDVLVVFDEAYVELADVPEFPQTIPLVQAGRAVLVTRTFSKAYGLSGLRIGYGIAPAPIAAALQQVREPFNVNLLAQAAAAAALDDDAHLEATRAYVRAGRQALLETVEALGWRAVPSATNFVLVEVGAAARATAQALLRQGIIVREMTAWRLDGFLRITIGTPEEMARLTAALRAIVYR